ncbi:hypothetical protein [Williamsia sterculiae]|uniref:Uncharacterized protein n=1 Tax=Williamsia sterculiae TaxID=1344003 RepID=A0A1N7H7S8_9NOCA|nr:hypothetical protein [Williamsia sterculiae]SIS20823.1 hypothetical protein SAMN05445060_3673 [Williamsia sterculiae]
MARDLNGAPLTSGDSVLRRLFRRDRAEDDLDVDDPSLVVVAVSDDPAASSGAVLEASAFVADRQAVLRHVLVLPDRSVDAVLDLAAQAGYRPTDVLPPALGADLDAGSRCVVLARPQLVDALHCSQERSRMAGLTARHDGEVLAWEVLQAPVDRVTG